MSLFYEIVTKKSRILTTFCADVQILTKSRRGQAGKFLPVLSYQDCSILLRGTYTSPPSARLLALLLEDGVL